MHNNKSEPRIDKPINLPKLKNPSEQSQSFSPVRFPSTTSLVKEKRSLMLLRQLRPAKDINQLSSDDDGHNLIKRIATPQKARLRPQIAVLSINKNKKQRVKNRFIKQIFIGEEAVQKFYDRYKNIDKYKQKQLYTKQKNVITQIVQLLDGYGFAPRKLDLIKLKGSHAILDLKTLGLGNSNMGSVVTEIFTLLGNFQYVDLSSNRIDRTLSEYLVSQLGKVKIVNLSNNRIGKIACDRFAELFYQPKTQIQQLYLSDNSLMDNAGAALIRGLSDYNYLRILDLTKNFMGPRFAQEMKQFLSKDRSLEQLYLGWNEFNDKAAKLIFEGVQQHTELKVFDYSWNLVGMFSVNSLEKLFRENQSLIHVDIAFCDIDKKNTVILAKALEQNHNIFGIHYEGNSGAIDHKGYLRLTQKQHNQYPLPIIKGLVRKIDSVHPNLVHNEFRENRVNDICWICDSWQEVYFNVRNSNPEIKQCYVHIKSQGYKSIKMQVGEGYFQTYRMVAIGQVQFFFTFYRGLGQKQHFASNNFPVRKFAKTIQFFIGEIKIRTFIEDVNYYQNQYVQDTIDQDYYPNIHCVPRSQQVRVNFGLNNQVGLKQVKKVIVKKRVIRYEKVKTKFRQLDESGAQEFLKDPYNRDGDKEYLLKCLQYDIANSKILKLIKQPDEIHRFKTMMIEYYRDFKDTFYYLANTNPALTGIYSVPEVIFLQFLEQQRYISKRVTLPKIMLKMYSCLSVGDEDFSPDKRSSEFGSKKGTQSTKLFCRPQFLEFLIRLALEKWCVTLPKAKKKKDEDKEKEEKKEEEKEEEQQGVNKKQKLVLPLPLVDGLQRTMKSLTKYADRVRASAWRRQKYLTIDIYTVLKGYQSFLTDLFEKYSENKKKLDKPKKIKNLLTLEQFKNIFIDAQIKRTKQACKDCENAFLDSKRLQIEDGNVQLALNYSQFCQCLARYSQIIWFPPVASQKNQLWQFEPNRRYLPLFIKLQSLIVNLYRKHTEFQNRRFNKIAQNGLFLQQTQILLQRIKQLDLGTRTDLAFKMNSLQQDQITLKGLIEGLQQKYKQVVVAKQEQIEQEQQRVDSD